MKGRGEEGGESGRERDPRGAMTEIRLEAVFPMDPAAFLRDRWTPEWMRFNASHSALAYHELREAYEKPGPDGTELVCKMEALGVDQDLPAKAAEFFGVDARAHGFEVMNAYRWRKAMTVGPPPYELQVRTATSLMPRGVGAGTLTLSKVAGQPGWCRQTLKLDVNVGVEMLGSLVERLIAGAFEEQSESLPRVQAEWSARRYAQQGSFAGGPSGGLRKDGGDDHGEEEAGSTPFPSFRGPGSMSGVGSSGGGRGMDPLELAGKLEAVGSGGYVLARPEAESEGKVSMDWLAQQQDAAEAAEPPQSWKDRASGLQGGSEGEGASAGGLASLPAPPGSPARLRTGSHGPPSVPSTVHGPTSSGRSTSEKQDLYAQIFMMDEHQAGVRSNGCSSGLGSPRPVASASHTSRYVMERSDAAAAVAVEAPAEEYAASGYRRRAPEERGEERGSWWCCCPPKQEPPRPPPDERYRSNWSPVARHGTPMHRRRRSHGSVYGAASGGDALGEPDSPGTE